MNIHTHIRTYIGKEQHEWIKKKIEEGDGLPDMLHTSAVDSAIKGLSRSVYICAYAKCVRMQTTLQFCLSVCVCKQSYRSVYMCAYANNLTHL